MDNQEREFYLQEEYKKRLKKIIGKKFQTTMIYALSQFETTFGDLFGYGKPDELLTQKERENKEKWLECRENILNLGNKQKRNAMTEIDMHKVEWLRYRKTVNFKEQV